MNVNYIETFIKCYIILNQALPLKITIWGKQIIDNVLKSIVFLLIWLQITAQHIERYYLDVQRLQNEQSKIISTFYFL